MRAILSRQAGPACSLELADLDRPTAGPGQLLVRTGAVALNFLDSLVIEDKYQARPPRPFSPGCELAGVVTALGAGVSGFAVGDRVVATTDFGALADYAVTDSNRTFKSPDGMPLEIAASMLVAYGTTLHGLADRAHLKSGETLLVLGASGGVGIAAIQLGKALGATVVAAVSSEQKSAAALTAGADRVVIYPRSPGAPDAVRSMSAQFKNAVGPAGANVVYDPVGGLYAEAALRAVAWNGRYLIVGFAAGVPRLPVNLTLLKECTLAGVFWGEYVKRNPAAFAAQFLELVLLWKAGRIRPPIFARFPLERAADAISVLTARDAIGKVIVRVDALSQVD